MLGLRDMQATFAATVLSGESGRLPLYLAPMTLGAERRIRVYRNHFTISLTECLAATFPVLKSLVGETYFDQCARRFAEEHPPSSPVLFEYGEGFPQFLAGMTHTDEYAYLADIGAFEWAINHAYHADDAPGLDTSALLAIADEERGRLILHPHPSARLVVSRYPVLEIWRRNQPGNTSSENIDLTHGGIRLLVWRNGIDVVWQEASAAEAAFVGALLARTTLAEACADALAEDAAFHPSAPLSDLIHGQALTGFALAP